jgi:hypothetical protein
MASVSKAEQIIAVEYTNLCDSSLTPPAPELCLQPPPRLAILTLRVPHMRPPREIVGSQERVVCMFCRSLKMRRGVLGEGITLGRRYLIVCEEWQ